MPSAVPFLHLFLLIFATTVQCGVLASRFVPLSGHSLLCLKKGSGWGARMNRGPALHPTASNRNSYLSPPFAFTHAVRKSFKEAQVHQRVADLNRLLALEGRDIRLLLVRCIDEHFVPNPAHFAHKHLHCGDKASLPKTFLPLFLDKGVDPPWHLLIEPVDIDDLCTSNLVSESTSKECSSRVAIPDESASTEKSMREVSISPLDFTAPENFIFLPAWAVEALNLEVGSVVSCRVASLPVAASVQLRPRSSHFVKAATAATGSLQTTLEKELRHYSSLTVGCTIPLRLEGELFLLDIVKLTTAEGKEVQQACTQDSDVAAELLPVASSS